MLFCAFFFAAELSAQRYTVDQKPKKSIFRGVKKIFRKKDPAEKQARKEEKKKDRSAKYEKKT